MAKPVDVSKVPFDKVRAHYYKSRTELVEKHSRTIDGRHRWPTDTCALRVSLALSLAGVRLPMVGAWVHVHDGKRLVLPAKASLFHKGPVLAGGEKLNSVVDLRKKKPGIVFMTPPDHITLWDGRECVDKTVHHYLSEQLYYWKLAAADPKKKSRR